MPDDEDSEAKAKQLRVESKTGSDADFMAAIDAQMEVLSRRRRGRRTTDAPVEGDQPAISAPEAGQMISVRADKLSGKSETALPATIQASPSEMHLSHTAPNVTPINLTNRSVLSEAVPGHDIALPDRPRVGDVIPIRQVVATAPLAQRTEVTGSAVPKQSQNQNLSETSPKTEPIVSEEHRPASAVTPPAPNNQTNGTANALSILNTEKLDSQVRRDPERETISADIPEDLPVEQLTTKYHLPIKQSRIKRHHPPVNTLVAVGLFLLLGLLIVMIAIDMQLIDPGFDLPFDFFHGS